MRYPEGGHQPSKTYTRAQASKAMELANQIIEKVDECLWYIWYIMTRWTWGEYIIDELETSNITENTLYLYDIVFV